MDKQNTLTANYDSIPLDLLLIKLEGAKAEADVAKRTVAELEKAITKRATPTVFAVRQAQQRFEGTVHAVVEGVEISSLIPKKVKWDQPALREAARQLETLGIVDPWDILKVDISIPERTYAALSPEILKIVSSARSVEHGKETISVVEKG